LTFPPPPPHLPATARIALYQARTGIDPAANAGALVAAMEEAAAGGAAILFTPAFREIPGTQYLKFRGHNT
jgi:predicted amidohydrolase